MGEGWQEVAARQCGVLSERSLREVGATRGFVRHQVRAGRWAERTHSVYTTTTGPLSPEQQRWVALEHAGPGSLLGGFTALEVHGLRGWHRPEVTVIVDAPLSFDDVPGVRFIRTRRPLSLIADVRDGLRVCRLEPAVLLLLAAHEPNRRTGTGAMLATVQQRLTTPERLLAWTRRLRPLRGAPVIRGLLADAAGGTHSMGEADVLRLCRAWGLAPPVRQRRRRDNRGHLRFTDCEWDLPDGGVLVLEIDGAFHLDVHSYGADVRRQRRLTAPGRTIVRCTTWEARHEPLELVRDLVALGVPRLAA